MTRYITLALAGALLTACNSMNPGLSGGSSPSNVAVDPNPQAPMGEAISEPSDGFENEISTDG